MLKKSEMKELATGWLSPSGEFYETNIYEHIRKAFEICSILYHIYPQNPEIALLSKGWVEIHKVVIIDYGYVFNAKGHMTMEQIRVLKPIVEKDPHMISEYSRQFLLEEIER